MTNDQIKEAISAKLGFDTKKYQHGGVICYHDKRGHMMAILPDYPKDLNEIHEAIEEVIVGNEELEKRFLKELNEILDRQEDDDTICIFLYETAQIQATAHQKSEAFLRTFDLWKE